MDMVTAQCTYGSAEQALGRTAVAQLGRFYDLPSFGLGGGVEAKLPDAEAAAQAMMGMLLNTLSGLTLTQCLGTLASGMYGAPEMAMICDEIVHMLRRVLGGITVSDETLAIEVIKQVGHSGNFMAEEHTARMFRKELFFPLLFRRQSIDRGSRWGPADRRRRPRARRADSGEGRPGPAQPRGRRGPGAAAAVGGRRGQDGRGGVVTRSAHPQSPKPTTGG
jgi:trimethylamine--corrinoid protein Co-methyltransferase